ncbi:MAG: TIGR02594 family protein [Phycisphaerales bacterium]|jgi:uncharacterized protein (TIGR02594 family)
MSAPVDPPWLAHARTLIGTREIPGSKHSPVIMDWIRKLGAKVLGINVVDDETPWCGTFMAWLMRQAGLNTPPIAVRASSWGLYGRGLLNPRLGCIMVFTRSGGGHVGLYVGEDAGAYHILGGNQSNAVTITRIAKERLSAMRWPDGVPLPKPQIVRLTPSGKLSENEA